MRLAAKKYLVRVHGTQAGIHDTRPEADGDAQGSRKSAAAELCIVCVHDTDHLHASQSRMILLQGTADLSATAASRTAELHVTVYHVEVRPLWVNCRCSKKAISCKTQSSRKPLLLICPRVSTFKEAIVATQ